MSTNQRRKLIVESTSLESANNAIFTIPARPARPYPTTRRGSFGIAPDFKYFEPSHWKTYEIEKSLKERKPLRFWNSPSLGLPSYVYEPFLSANHFRLLQILQYDSSNSTLTVGLEPHAIDAAPVYTALSYTWGHPTLEHVSLAAKEVVCDGATIEVTKNLFTALVRLAQDQDSQHKYFWADALCINQSNASEIAQQVQLMREIYSCATSVLVWLGDAEIDSDLFMNATKVLHRTMKKLGTFNDLKAAEPFDKAVLARMDMSREEWTQLWEEYFIFYHTRRWFRRAWIIQEVALAKELIFLCGPHTLPWEDMYELGMMVRSRGWRHLLAASLPHPEGGGLSTGLSDELDRLLEYRSQVKEGGPEDQYMQDTFRLVDGAQSKLERYFSFFQYVVQEGRRYNSSDLKDKIFSVLGMANMFLPPDVISPITPDYSLSWRDIYSATARAFMQELPLLSSLSYVEDGKRRGIGRARKGHGLPSWAPDYSVPLGRVPFIRLGKEDYFNASRIDIWPKVRIQSLKNPSYFPVHGIHITEIVQTSEPLDSLARNSFLYPLLDICQRLPLYYQPTGEHRLEAFWRTLIANTTLIPTSIQPAPDSYAACFHDWCLTILHHYYTADRGRLNLLSSQLPRLHSLISGPSPPPPSSSSSANTNNTNDSTVAAAAARHLLPSALILRLALLAPTAIATHARPSAYLFARALKRVSADRVLFRTASGHLGLGPATARSGDSVWLVRGARVPFVLREGAGLDGEDGDSGSEDDDDDGQQGQGQQQQQRVGWEVVGEAYVHGGMNGEWVGKGEGEESPFEEIVLV